MTREEIGQAMTDAGWELEGSFSGYLVVGEDHHLSILAPSWAWGSADPACELCDGERGLTYWVREIPTPRQGTELLEEHGGLPEEERGNPRKNDAVNGEGEHHRRET